MMKQLCAFLAALVLFVCGASHSRADMLITSRSALGATDSIDWGQLGAPTPGVAGVPNPSGVTSMGGTSFTVSENGGNFSRLDQGLVVGAGPWFGNFAPGDHLLYTGTGYGGGFGPMDIASNGPLMFAAGAQIMRNSFGAFTATVTALDALGNPIASFTEDGLSNDNTDNSAIFIGIRTDLPFKTLVLTTDTSDFAINLVSLSNSQSVPEPSSLTVLGIGALGLIGFGRWRCRK
jgi:hypothetical protein